MESASTVPFYNESTGKWEVVILGPDNKMKRVEERDTESAAYAFISEHDKSQLLQKPGKVDKPKAKPASKKKTEMQRIQDDKSTLESMLNDTGMPMEGDLPMDNIKTPEEIEEEKQAFKEDFEREEEECSTQAKELLIQIAKVYLKVNIIDSNEYLKYKLNIEERSLSSLMFQLKTSRRAIYKLSEEIHMGNSSPRMYEVLTGLQRIVLDISKFNHEYVQSIEKSMKQFQEDMLTSAAGITGMDNPQGQLPENTEGAIVLHTSDRKKIQNELTLFIEESNARGDNSIPRSQNTKLHDDDPNVVDAEYINHLDGDEVGGPESSGLRGFEDDEDDDL